MKDRWGSGGVVGAAGAGLKEEKKTTIAGGEKGVKPHLCELGETGPKGTKHWRPRSRKTTWREQREEINLPSSAIVRLTYLLLEKEVLRDRESLVRKEKAAVKKTP